MHCRWRDRLFILLFLSDVFRAVVLLAGYWSPDQEFLDICDFDMEQDHRFFTQVAPDCVHFATLSRYRYASSRSCCGVHSAAWPLHLVEPLRCGVQVAHVDDNDVMLFVKGAGDMRSKLLAPVAYQARPRDCLWLHQY